MRHWEDYRKLREEIKLIQRDKAVFLFTARLLDVILSTTWVFLMINLIVTTIYLWSFYVFFQFFFSSWQPLARAHRKGLQKIKVKMQTYRNHLNNGAFQPHNPTSKAHSSSLQEQQSFACVQHEKKRHRITGIVPSYGVSNTNGSLCNLWRFYFPHRAVRIIPTRHILGVVPCKIPI